MEAYKQYLAEVISELGVLSEDIKKLIAENFKEEQDGKRKDFKDVSLKSMQSTIKLFKTKEEANEAKEIPELDFIRSQLEKILDK